MIFFYFLTGCADETVVQEEDQQFIDLYARVSIIKEIKTDSLTREELLREAFQQGQSSPPEFKEKIRSYQAEPERWAAFLQQVRDRIREFTREGLQKKPE